MQIDVSADGFVTCRAGRFRCALGQGGVSVDKREGDGATPAGSFPLRRVLYRADRLSRPPTALETRPIAPHDGWCDDPADAAHYNTHVVLPHPTRCERLWRADGVYDVLVVLGHNDAPPIPGRGSAIFLHVAKPNYAPTEGCVALALAHLLLVLTACDETSTFRISA
jgi:L,D-peptidoglycan transpeptidase YkuD (ErfK/YbiS/YcfS/YnhG family)